MTHPTEPIKPAEAELLKAKEALWKQAEWLRVTLASIGDAVITTDTDGNILTMNAVAQNLAGAPSSPVKGMPGLLLDFIDGKHSRA